MSGRAKLPVPKFGSFKPKKSTNKADTVQDDDSETKNERQEVRMGNHRVERDSRHDRSRRQSQSHRPKADHYSPHDRKPRSKRHHDRNQARADEADGMKSRLAYLGKDDRGGAFIDIKGDPANFQYGMSNKWTVPAYRLYGSGSILGLDPDIKIDRNRSGQSSYTLIYPPKKRQFRIVEPVEVDEPLEHATGDEDTDDDQKVEANEGHETQDHEMDFVSMPFEEKDDEGKRSRLAHHGMLLTAHRGIHAHHHTEDLVRGVIILHNSAPVRGSGNRSFFHSIHHDTQMQKMAVAAKAWLQPRRIHTLWQ